MRSCARVAQYAVRLVAAVFVRGRIVRDIFLAATAIHGAPALRSCARASLWQRRDGLRGAPALRSCARVARGVACLMAAVYVRARITRNCLSRCDTGIHGVPALRSCARASLWQRRDGRRGAPALRSCARVAQCVSRFVAAVSVRVCVSFVILYKCRQKASGRSGRL